MIKKIKTLYLGYKWTQKDLLRQSFGLQTFLIFLILCSIVEHRKQVTRPIVSIDIVHKERDFFSKNKTAWLNFRFCHRVQLLRVWRWRGIVHRWGATLDDHLDLIIIPTCAGGRDISSSAKGQIIAYLTVLQLVDRSSFSDTTGNT